MCMDCGCGVAHGDPTHANHLMVENLKQMAEADGISVSQVLLNINEAAEKDRADHPAEWA